jgi:uncharacterized protein
MADPLRGRFVWNELMTTNPLAAADFYGKVVGWKTQPWKRDPSYSTFVAPSGPAAGLMLLPLDAKAAGAPPSWMTYVGTPNVEGTVRLAERLGGHLLRGVTATPDVGRWAILSDPQGAVFAAFTPDSTKRDVRAPALGEFSWHELTTTDHRAAFGFYAELFGWEKVHAHDMGPMGEYLIFGLPGEPPCGGTWDKPKEMPAPPHWLCYVRVDDVKAAAGRIDGAGGRLLNGPTEVPGGDWIAQGLDPQGAAFALHFVAPAGAPQAAPPAKGKSPQRPALARKKAPTGKAPARKAPAKKARAAKKAPAAKKVAAKRPAARKSLAPTRKGRAAPRAAPRKGAPSGKPRARPARKRR